jgi:hypothetical protein
MPSVIDAPARLTDENLHDLSSAQPGFWRTLAQSIVRPYAQQPRRMQRSCAMTRPQTMETPVELWARQYPKLYLQAFANQ